MLGQQLESLCWWWKRVEGKRREMETDWGLALRVIGIEVICFLVWVSVLR